MVNNYNTKKFLMLAGHIMTVKDVAEILKLTESAAYKLLLDSKIRK